MSIRRSKARPTAMRSGLEEVVKLELDKLGLDYGYEKAKLVYIVPEREHTYTPDFIMPGGWFIEVKGLWDKADRMKMNLVKAQHPEIDICMLFQRAKSPIYKGSKTTYAMYASKIGLDWAQIPTKAQLKMGMPLIPAHWLEKCK